MVASRRVVDQSTSKATFLVGRVRKCALIVGFDRALASLAE
jgi:hypothetical protein